MRIIRTRPVRAVILSSTVFAGLALSPVVMAQAQTNAPDSPLGDIVVTAQKKETNLQKTPVAISVMSGDDLKARGITGLTGLMDGSIPSLRIAPFGSRNSALTVGIRGIVPFDANQPSRDAGVGVYIDGVYLGRAQGLGAALYDVERIEVLKGPQGTLFGRNSTGGALSIVTREPSGEFHLRQTAGIGNFGSYKVETHLDLPSFHNFSVKIDGIVNKRGGTTNNPMAGEADFNQSDQRGLHAAVRWKPAPNFSVDYGFDISRDESTPYYSQLMTKVSSAVLASAVQVQPDRARTADVGVPLQPSVGKNKGHVLHMDWEVAQGINLRSITSYRELSQSQFDNAGAHMSTFAANATFGRYSLAGLTQNQFSQELQVVGSLSRLEFVAGAYYYHEKGDDWAWTPNTMRWGASVDDAPTRLGSLAEGQQVAYPDRVSDAVADSLALYGQATWTPAVLADALHLTAGARYTHDRKHGELSKVNGADTDYTFRTSSNRIDPSFTLAYDIARGLHAYAKWGTAYRAGGANSRSISYRAFKPEEVETAELGFKSEFFDRHVRFNVAAYRTLYKSQQIDFSATNLDGTNRGSTETVNIDGTGTIKGLEADLTVAPLEGLTLSASYAYTKGDLGSAINPFANDRQENVNLIYTPKNAYSVGADYSRPLNWGTLRLHLDAAGSDGYHSLANDALKTDKSFLVNGRISLADITLAEGAALDVSLWSRNLFNEQHTFTAMSLLASYLGRTGSYNDPRTYGLEATVKF